MLWQRVPDFSGIEEEAKLTMSMVAVRRNCLNVKRERLEEGAVNILVRKL